MKKTLKIGSNRGKPRVWIEGQALSAAGWEQGAPFECEFRKGSVVYRRKDGGDRRVAKAGSRPVIDTNTTKLTESLGEDTTHTEVTITPDTITLRPGKPPTGRLKKAVVAVALIAAPYITQFAPNAQRVFVACEESATVRDAFLRRGHDAVSCDILPTRNPYGWHIEGPVEEWLDKEWDTLIGFPPCPYLTCSAEWAYADPDYDRYPGVGYHQKVGPDTLTGAARRKAREEAHAFFMLLWESCDRVALENPRGALSSLFRKPDQIVQPFQFGHPESKATCLWLKNLQPLEPTDLLAIEEHGWLTPGGVWRWQNQTASGQNRIPPGKDRSKKRSKTYFGIGEAMATTWG